MEMEEDAAQLARIRARRDKRRIAARAARTRFLVVAAPPAQEPHDDDAPHSHPPPRTTTPTPALLRVAFVLFRSDAFWSALSRDPKERAFAYSPSIYRNLCPLKALLSASRCLRADLLELPAPPANPLLLPPPYKKKAHHPHTIIMGLPTAAPHPLLVPSSILSRALTLLLPFNPAHPIAYTITAKTAALNLALPEPLVRTRMLAVQQIVMAAKKKKVDQQQQHEDEEEDVVTVTPHSLATAQIKTDHFVDPSRIPFLDALRLLVVVPSLLPSIAGVVGLARVAADRTAKFQRAAKAAAKALDAARTLQTDARPRLDTVALTVRPYRFCHATVHQDTITALYAADDALVKLRAAIYNARLPSRISHAHPNDHTRPLTAAHRGLTNRLHALAQAYTLSMAREPSLPPFPSSS